MVEAYPEIGHLFVDLVMGRNWCRDLVVKVVVTVSRVYRRYLAGNFVYCQSGSPNYQNRLRRLTGMADGRKLRCLVIYCEWVVEEAMMVMSHG